MKPLVFLQNANEVVRRINSYLARRIQIFGTYHFHNLRKWCKRSKIFIENCFPSRTRFSLEAKLHWFHFVLRTKNQLQFLEGTQQGLLCHLDPYGSLTFTSRGYPMLLLRLSIRTTKIIRWYFFCCVLISLAIFWCNDSAGIKISGIQSRLFSNNSWQQNWKVILSNFSRSANVAVNFLSSSHDARLKVRGL